jgi:hypothetical protein
MILVVRTKSNILFVLELFGTCVYLFVSYTEQSKLMLSQIKIKNTLEKVEIRSGIHYLHREKIIDNSKDSVTSELKNKQ